ncbi:hypothetical protein RRG08_063925 [Elysia crispata]|uniref:Secreted protein n=1 Tax=Elysia crispata TaxID=231223 RepID=A0AAE0YEB8_9GAST|nr:hypothetical protein RRG08_063925 [Elysia crispata]
MSDRRRQHLVQLRFVAAATLLLAQPERWPGLPALRDQEAGTPSNRCCSEQVIPGAGSPPRSGLASSLPRATRQTQRERAWDNK